MREDNRIKLHQSFNQSINQLPTTKNETDREQNKLKEIRDILEPKRGTHQIVQTAVGP